MSINNSSISFLRDYISNIRVDIHTYGFIKVWNNWREIDYTPCYNKFYLICDGEGWLKIGEREYYPHAGQLFLMPQGVKQSYSTINENLFTKYWCHFEAKIGDINLFDIIKTEHFIEVSDMSTPEQYFKSIIGLSSEDSVTALLEQKAVMIELISYYLKNSFRGRVVFGSKVPDMLNEVLNYINSHLEEEISLEKLSKIVHLHPNYFIRFFRKHIGSSPIQYINNKRLENAKRLLKGTSLSIGEVAAAAGIGDIYYMSRLFKEKTGYTPTEYRRMSAISLQ